MHFIKSCRYAYKHGVKHIYLGMHRNIVENYNKNCYFNIQYRKWKTKQPTCEV